MATRAERSEIFLERGAEFAALRESGMTLDKIAETMGVSRSRVGQILRAYAERSADKKESPNVA